MEIGDYVRFYDRSWTEIGQITGFVEDSHLKIVKCRDGYYDMDNFIKSSPNIIDLIEERDIVVIINGLNEEELILIKDLKREKPILESHKIKSIVTKEAFESMEYKIGE